MIDAVTAPYAALILRVCLGIMFVAHAMLKVRVFTIPGTVAFLNRSGLPGWLADVTIAAELAGRLVLFSALSALRRAPSHSPHPRNDRDRARQERLGLRQHRRRLGVSGVLGGRLVRAIPARRRRLDARAFAAVSRLTGFARRRDHGIVARDGRRVLAPLHCTYNARSSRPFTAFAAVMSLLSAVINAQRSRSASAR